eukprot:12657401-Prorocentrum_lima.AAC.1
MHLVTCLHVLVAPTALLIPLSRHGQGLQLRGQSRNLRSSVHHSTLQKSFTISGKLLPRIPRGL